MKYQNLNLLSFISVYEPCIDENYIIKPEKKF